MGAQQHAPRQERLEHVGVLVDNSRPTRRIAHRTGNAYQLTRGRTSGPRSEWTATWFRSAHGYQGGTPAGRQVGAGLHMLVYARFVSVARMGSVKR